MGEHDNLHSLPARIGRYEIKAELGRGGMATVYRGFDPRFKREVAIKVLSLEALHDPTFRPRFEREVEAIARLEHSAVVPVYDTGEEQGCLFLVMRLMPSGSLADRLREGPLTLSEAARIISRIAAALDRAHSHGIIHRDIKPANILFDAEGEPYLSDFGLIRIASERQDTLTAVGGIVGTPAYMSPEQARGEEADARSDVYSLGAMLFHMLSGRTPYEGDSPVSILIKHITEPVPRILQAAPNLPPACEALIQRAMAKKREERFATAGELAAALTAIAQGGYPAIRVESLDLPDAGAMVVSRPRLLVALDRAAGGRLTLVIASAGYGKTTLLSEWMRGQSTPGLWRTLGELDNDPAHLLEGLAADLRSRYPEISSPLATGPLSYGLVRLFQQAAQVAGGPWLLVLDDYHLITNAAIHQALDTVLGLPTWPVHLVIASRSLPPLAAVARLRLEGRLAELDEADLRFTVDETRSFLAASGLVLDESEARQVAERTEGWPSALQLVCQAAQRARHLDLAAILGRIGDERPMFDYLAGQVLDQQTEAVQDFLRRTSLLPYLSAELCNAYLNINHAAALLDELERRHMFIARLDEAPGRRYRYHALFQEFLRRCLEHTEGAAAVNNWRRRAAACLLERPTFDDAAAAIDHLLAARDWTSAANAIESTAQRLDLGQFSRMEPWFGFLPPEVVATRPGLLLALGLLRVEQGRWNEALEALARAEQLSPTDGGSDLLVQVWFQQAWAHFRLGHYAQTQALCQQTLAYLHNVGAEYRLRDQARAYNLLGGCYTETDDLARGEQCLQQTLRLYRQLGDRLFEAVTLSNIAGNIYLIQGRLAETVELGAQAQRILDELGSYRVCYVLTALGNAYRLRGEYAAARAILERQLQLTDVHQDRMMRGYALYSLGHLHREQGRWEAARACYDEARLLGEELQEPFVLFEPRLGLALLGLAEGDLRAAQRHGQAALQQARAVSNRHQEGLALTALGLAADQQGNAPQAEAHWRDALQLFEALGANYDRATIHLYLADLARREGRDEEAIRHLGQALELSSTYGYDFLLTGRERRRALPLLVTALGQSGGVLNGLQVSEACRLLTLIGQQAVEPLFELLDTAPDDEVRARAIQLLGEIGDEHAALALNRLRRERHLKETVQVALARIAAAPRPPLRVLALGDFEVWRGSELIAPQTWQPRRKARLLLLYLLSRARRPVACDELIEALWSDLAPDSARRALNTTFSDLRRILEPYLGKGQPSRYLTRDEETLAFTGAAWYDVAEFQQAVRAGGQAARQALELYRGDFLPEEPYTGWALRERERLRGLYLNTLTAWLDERVQAGEWREGVELARRILEQEPWLEEVWRALMLCLARLGRRSEALHAYQECTRALQQELDVAPSAETQALYDELKIS